MAIDEKYSTLLNYGFCQKLFEKYYRYRRQTPCFVLKQNNRWTIVTYNTR